MKYQLTDGDIFTPVGSNHPIGIQCLYSDIVNQIELWMTNEVLGQVNSCCIGCNEWTICKLFSAVSQC